MPGVPRRPDPNKHQHHHVPLAVVALFAEPQRPVWTWLLAAVLTTIFHVLYGIVLQRGYAVGDLSVMPLGERPGLLGPVFVGVLSPVAYFLVLDAMRMAPISLSPRPARSASCWPELRRLPLPDGVR